MRRLGTTLGIFGILAVSACSEGPIAPVPEAPTGMAISAIVSGGSVDLVSGRNLDIVGSVMVDKDGDGNITVTYTTNAGFCLLETHFDIQADGGDGIPVNGGGNPKIGNFDYGDGSLDCVSSYSETIPAAEVPGAGPWEIAAHAVVATAEPITDGEQLIYGIFDGPNGGLADDGELYAIDPITMTTTMIAALDDMAPGKDFSPNGLATDPVNRRLYFTVDLVDNVTDLYFWDLDNAIGDPATHAGQLTAPVFSGSFHNGSYYYVPNKSRDLWMATFDGAGMVASNTMVCSSIGGTSSPGLEFGDIAITPDGIVYGSAQQQNASTDPANVIFFRMDLAAVDPCADAYVNTSPDSPLLQLALSQDGTLYGHVSVSAEQPSDPGQWFNVDKASGDATQILGFDTESFTDLSNGIIEFGPGDDETAWGMGTQFTGRSWAMFFDFTG